MRKDKLKLWNTVETTDPKYTKKVNQRGGFTAIAAQSQIKKATEVFGPAGIGWGVKNEEFTNIEGTTLVLYTSTLWYVFNSETGEFPIRLFEDPSPIIDINYNDIDKILLNITPKDTTEYCSPKEEFECVTDDSCIWDSECLGKQYPIQKINMDFDLIILDKNKPFIDLTATELSGISIIGDSSISI